MTLISVITPVAPGTPPEYLAAAYTCLTIQELPPNHQWEWLVQLDGHGELALPEPAVRDPRVQPGSGPHGGAGMARNLALARSGGKIVVNLDADDQLTPGALGRIINAMIDPEVGWTTSALVDLLPDGSHQRFDGDPPAGQLHRGSITRYWKTHDWALQVHPSTLAARRTLLVGVGGWMGLPVSEDMGLLVALDQTTHGAFIAEPGLIRRIHPAQMTQQPEHPLMVSQLRALVWERATALDSPSDPRQEAQILTPAQNLTADQHAPPRPAASAPARRNTVARWPVLMVVTVALLQVGVCIGIGAATPDRWAEVLGTLAVSSVFYSIFGWLAIVVSNRIKADSAPS